MNENIIPFPKNEQMKIGFYELKDIHLTFSNLFDQTLDPQRALNTRNSIAAIKTEVALIKNKISEAVSNINGLRPDMPTPTEFRNQVWEALCLPLQYGHSLAAISYYGIETDLQELTQQYQDKRDELKQFVV